MKQMTAKATTLAALCLVASMLWANAFWGFGESEEPVIVAAVTGAVPVAQEISQSTVANIMIEVSLQATDADGDAVIYQLDTLPRMGTAQIDNDVLRYTPQSGETGTDKFSYCAVDAMGNVSEPAQITISVDKNKVNLVYADMSDNPSHLAAVKLAEAGVLWGERIGTSYFLHPNDAVTRSEFIAMAAAVAELEVTQTMQTDFADDTSLSAWAKPYISAATQCGWVSGYVSSSGTAEIRGAQQITLAEASVILARMVSAQIDLPISVMSTVDGMESVPAWAVDEAQLLTAAGILTDEFGAVQQSTYMTRGDAVELLYRAMLVLN